MRQVIDQVQRQGPLETDSAEYTDPSWRSPLTGNRHWIVRNTTNSLEKGNFTIPTESEALKTSISRCKDCRKNKVYSDPDAALAHLRLRHLPSREEQSEDENQARQEDTNVDLRNWIRNDGQVMIEERNAAYLIILSKTVAEGWQILSEAGQLANGVAVEKGKISDRYAFPPALLESFRRLIIFFLAIERAIHFTDQRFQNRDVDSSEEETPFSKEGLEVLERFFSSAQSSLLDARKDLCIMVRSDPAEDILMRLCLGPEFILAWLMRRLLVRPVENSMRVADLYRAYLSTVVSLINVINKRTMLHY